jgi:ubiquinone/menaquinone biosynthesis C-methylase UbiE
MLDQTTSRNTMDARENPIPPPEVSAYYEVFPEETRLTSGSFRLEFQRTKDILSRILPAVPARVVDVGGAAGAYSAWLAEQGYEVHLIDAVPRLVEEARRRNVTLSKPIASFSVADARALPQEDSSAAAVLIMGPLYHLPAAADRIAALKEAFRILTEGGIAVVAAISRYASALDGLARKLSLDPLFLQIRNQDLANGQHRNDTDMLDYFTTAYFHRPKDLRLEMETTGFIDVKILGVEGPGWMLPDFDARWENPVLRNELLEVAQRLESESSIIGASAHLLGTGRKRR